MFGKKIIDLTCSEVCQKTRNDRSAYWTAAGLIENKNILKRRIE